MNTSMEIIKSIVFNEFDEDFVDDILQEKKLEEIDIFEDLNFDSIRFIQLVVSLENCFKTEIPDEKLLMENFASVGQIIALIEENGENA